MRSKQLFVIVMTLLLLHIGLLGCGRKDWPEPMAEQERFDITDPTGNLGDGCLEVRARLRGASGNLTRLVLELQPTGEDAACPTCPFHAEQRIEVPLDAPNLEISKRSLLLTHCGLERGRAYRWRLVGYSGYPGIKPVSTRAYFNEP